MEIEYRSVVFAGGGCRCFWQSGFWDEVGEFIAPRVVAGVSAGAAFACSALAGTSQTVLTEFKRRTHDNPSNLHLRELRRARTPFPHHAMYRGTIEATTDEHMLRELRTGPEILVLLAHPPARWRPTPAIAAGLLSYRVEQMFRGRGTPRWPAKLGFVPRVVRANDCNTPGELADLILQSSCLPPLMPMLRRDGLPVVDGAVIDSAPAHLVTHEPNTLVLLTHHADCPPPAPQVTYVRPSRPVPIDLWDYAHPERVQATYDLGREDGAAFRKTLLRSA